VVKVENSGFAFLYLVFSHNHCKLTHMKTKMLLYLPLILFFCSCSVEIEKDSVEKWKDEILETEKNFALMAGKDGISKAFMTFAAEDAVLMRNDKLVIGKKNLVKQFENQASKPKDESLDWKPDFVDVSASGDLAYTYGHFTYSYTDSTGTKIESSGVFHTVWKRQADGSWKFVWD
jgi:ketosteroid isomerase-like protein